MQSHAEGGPRCSTASAMSGESLAGTASPGLRWLLVEIAGAWGWSAFTGSPALDPELGRAIVRRAESEGMRILAIRRPGRERREGRWRWAIAETDPGSEELRWGEAAEPAELLEAPFVPGAGTASTDPVIAVCAHGRHDECCAVRGRRAAADLAERFPDWTWECSHLGGDRFAATMLVLPFGLNYGRVDHTDGPHLIDEYLAGRIVPDHYRGRTAFSRAVQTAQHAAREEFGDLGIAAYPPLSTRATEHGTIVELAGDGATITVELEEGTGDPLYTMCTATHPVRVRTLRPVTVSVGERRSLDAEQRRT
jgi:hypothetical protein